MKTTSLKGELRTETGKSESKQLRRTGFVPCSISGENTNVNFQVDERALKSILYTPDTFLIQIEIDGKTYPTILKEAQFDKVSDRPIHLDFQLVNESNPITTSLPVLTKGQAEGVKAGGKLLIMLRRVNVKGLIKDIPNHIELDITNLNVGKTITIGEIKLNGVTLLHPNNISVVGVRITRNVVEETPTAATTAAPAAATTAAPAAQPAKK